MMLNQCVSLKQLRWCAEKNQLIMTSEKNVKVKA